MSGNATMTPIGLGSDIDLEQFLGWDLSMGSDETALIAHYVAPATLTWGGILVPGRDLTPEQDASARLDVATGARTVQVRDLETGQVQSVTLPDCWALDGADVAEASVRAIGAKLARVPSVDYHADGLLVAGRYLVAE